MFQRADFPQILRGREILEFWHKLSRTSKSVDGLIDGLGLSRFVDKPIKQLSGGEKRRLDLACALMSKPKLLFLDEPTTGLDPEVRASTWEIIKSAQDEGVTIVLTTHYLEEVEELAQDIVLLHQGSLRLSGTLEDILSGMSPCFSLRLPAGVLLPDTLGVEPEYMGDGEVRIWTANIQEDSRAVLQWLSVRGIDVSDSYREYPANLRSIFLKIASA